MNEEKIAIVDENDEVIGSKPRSKVGENDIYRVAALWINNSKNQILLARRHHTKKNHPNKWGPAVAGTVGERESYEDNIIKESEEELGLINISPKIGPKDRVKGEFNHFTQWFILTIDKEINEFTIQKEEVEEIKWFSKEELIKELEENTGNFLPNMKEYFELLENE